MIPKYSFNAYPYLLRNGAYVVRFDLSFESESESVTVPAIWTIKDIRQQFPWWLRWACLQFVAKRISNLFAQLIENVGDCLNDIGMERRGEFPYTGNGKEDQ